MLYLVLSVYCWLFNQKQQIRQNDIDPTYQNTVMVALLFESQTGIANSYGPALLTSMYPDASNNPADFFPPNNAQPVRNDGCDHAWSFLSMLQWSLSLSFCSIPACLSYSCDSFYPSEDSSLCNLSDFVVLSVSLSSLCASLTLTSVSLYLLYSCSSLSLTLSVSVCLSV